MNLNKLIQWSQKDFQDLPWRTNRTLYRTLVSEIMLQQTTVSTVKNHYERFLQRFPDLPSLAKASEHDLLVAWKGLGYYRRARNLKKIAEYIHAHHKGEFPTCVDELQKIPGIGPYTAHALVAIGTDARGLAVDANLERVIARLYGLKIEKGLKLQKKILELWKQNKIFSHFKLSYRALNESLMDLGRTYCQARKTACELCPLNQQCKAFQGGEPLSYPLEKKATSEANAAHDLQLLRVIIQRKNKILVYKKSEREWLAGQFEVPTFIISCTDKKLRQYPALQFDLNTNDLITFKTGITKYKIENFVSFGDQKSLKQWGFSHKTEWRELDDENSNFSTASSKALKKMASSKIEKNRDQE